MANFGIGQLTNGTPTLIKRIRDAFLFLIAGSLAFVTILAPKFGVTAEDFAQWCGFIMLGVKFVSMLFGVTDEEAVSKARETIREINNKQ